MAKREALCEKIVISDSAGPSNFMKPDSLLNIERFVAKHTADQIRRNAQELRQSSVQEVLFLFSLRQEELSS